MDVAQNFGLRPKRRGDLTQSQFWWCKIPTFAADPFGLFPSFTICIIKALLWFQCTGLPLCAQLLVELPLSYLMVRFGWNQF